MLISKRLWFNIAWTTTLLVRLLIAVHPSTYLIGPNHIITASRLLLAMGAYGDPGSQDTDIVLGRVFLTDEISILKASINKSIAEATSSLRELS
jgi:hypothetical protein